MAGRKGAGRELYQSACLIYQRSQYDILKGILPNARAALLLALQTYMTEKMRGALGTQSDMTQFGPRPSAKNAAPGHMCVSNIH